MRKFHLVLGLMTLLVFVLTGAYMRFVAHPSQLADRPHLMFVSRHIYILANALVQLALGAYVVPFATRVGRNVQWIGSSLIAASSVLLVTAFILEPMAGHPRTLVSSFGIYTLFAGTILHFVIALRADARRY